MAGVLTKHGVPALGWWLIAVGTFRSGALCSATYSEIPMTGIHGRTVAVWTLLSCTLCFLCAFNLDSKPVYAATFLSFFYALSHLVAECMVYHTISAARLSLFIFIADLPFPMLGHPCCFISGTAMAMAPVPVLVGLPSSPNLFLSK